MSIKKLIDGIARELKEKNPDRFNKMSDDELQEFCNATSDCLLQLLIKR